MPWDIPIAITVVNAPLQRALSQANGVIEIMTRVGLERWLCQDIESCYRVELWSIN